MYSTGWLTVLVPVEEPVQDRRAERVARRKGVAHAQVDFLGNVDPKVPADIQSGCGAGLAYLQVPTRDADFTAQRDLPPADDTAPGTGRVDPPGSAVVGLIMGP